MEYKIIQVNNYLLAVVNDKKRGWFYCVRRKSFFHDEGEDVLCCNGDLSVEAHLPLNGANIIENLPLLPPLEQEDDVEKLAKIENPVLLEDDWDKNKQYRDEWIKGYNKAKEKYKYTEEDLRKAYMSGKHGGVTETYYEFEEFIQSLSQPKMPIGFECEIHDTVFGNINTGELLKWKPKTTINSQGQSVWVGKYIY